MWWALDAEVVMEGGRIVRTRNPTGHAVLVDARFELPCGKFWLSSCTPRCTVYSITVHINVCVVPHLSCTQAVYLDVWLSSLTHLKLSGYVVCPGPSFHASLKLCDMLINAIALTHSIFNSCAYVLL